MNFDQEPIKVTPTDDASWELGAHFVEVAAWRVTGRFGKVENEVAAAKQRVALADVSASGKIAIEGQAAGSVLQKSWAVPRLAIGQGAKLESKRVYRLRSDQYFIHSEPGAEGAAIKALYGTAEEIGELVAISDVTHGQAELILIGPRCRELLGRLCSLDFHPSQFADLTAKQGSAAKIRQLIIRHDMVMADGEPVPAFSLIGARSLAVYLWQTIREAGHDLELDLIGQLAIEGLSASD